MELLQKYVLYLRDSLFFYFCVSFRLLLYKHFYFLIIIIKIIHTNQQNCGMIKSMANVIGNGLTDRQNAFIVEYLKDLNGTQAAIRAGYAEDSANNEASRLLTNEYIREAIKSKLIEREEKSLVSVDYVINGLKECAERCMQRKPVLTRDGKVLIQVEEDGEGVWEFNSVGATRSFELLGKYLKLFTDKLEHTGKDGAPLVDTIKVIWGEPPKKADEPK
jgi:phage terminase small subunit